MPVSKHSFASSLLARIAARSADCVKVFARPSLFHLREEEEGDIKGPTMLHREGVRVPVPFAIDERLHRGVKDNVRLESLLRELRR